MPGSTWESYRSGVDQILGTLDKPTYDAIWAYASSPPSQGENYAARAAAAKALTAQGYSDAQANALLDAAQGLHQNPNGSPTPFGVSSQSPALLDSMINDAKSGKYPGKKPTDPGVDAITKRIQEFADKTATTDPAILDQLRRWGTSQGQQQAGAAGVWGAGAGGGLSQLGQAGIATDLQTKYSLQQQGLHEQALGLLNQRDIGLGQLALGYNQLLQSQADAKWAAQKNQAQGIGAGVGTIGGAILGGYLGGPEGAAAGMKIGSSAGGGIGGLLAGGNGPSYQQAPNIQWSGSRGSGGSGTGF